MHQFAAVFGIPVGYSLHEKDEFVLSEMRE